MSPLENRRIVLVEDDALLRDLLRSQIASWGFEVKAASSAKEAVAVCEDFDPDCLVLDVDLGPGLNGFQLAEAMVRRMNHVAVVFLTRFPDARAYISRLSDELRSVAYVNKGAVENAGELKAAIDAALTDRGVSIRHDRMRDRPMANLTRSQLDVLRLMHAGLTNQQIAAERGSSLSATENLIGRTFRALGIDSGQANPRATAVRIYAESYGSKSK